MSDSTLNKIIRFLADEANEIEIEEVQKWKKLHANEYEKIRLIFETTPFESKDFDFEIRKKQVFDKIQTQINKRPDKRLFILHYWRKIAAVVLVLVAVGIAMSFYSSSLQFEYQNLSDQVYDIELPDGSIITLDKNSLLSYKLNWLQQFTRKVNLSGRAYFQIVKETPYNFQVLTEESQIEVLGTKFIVSDNFDKIQVVLNEGKIQVTSKHTDKMYLLKTPGEQLIISDNGKVKQGLINQNLYFSWLQDKLNFNNCMVSEAIIFLMDSYNLNIVLNDQIALNKHLFGSAPSDNPFLILEAIAKITDKHIRNDQHSIILD